MARRVTWTLKARTDLRAIDRDNALEVLHAIARFLSTNEGDVKRLVGIDPPEFRLRAGRYRVRFYDHGDSIEILSVQHRKDAYR